MPPLPDVRPDDPHVDPRRILRLFRPYTGRLVLVGLLIAASSLVGLGSPFRCAASSTTPCRTRTPDCWPSLPSA